MKKIFKISFIIFVGLPLKSQLYNLFNDNGVRTLQGRCIIETDSSYVGINKSFMDSIDGGGISVNEFDKINGRVLKKSKPYYNELIWIYDFNNSNFCHFKENKISFLIGNIAGDYESLMNYDLSSKGIKEDLKIENDSNYYHTFLSDGIFYNDIYFRSGQIRSNFDDKISIPVLTLIDTNKNIKQYLYEYDTTNYFNNPGPITIYDSTIIYITLIDNRITRKDQIRILEIDLNGKLKKETILPENLILHLPIRVVAINKDSILFTCYKGKKNPEIANDYIYQPVVILYNLKQSKVLKIQNFGISDYNDIDSYPCLIKAKDGNFIYAGTERFLYNIGADSARLEQKGVIGKIDTNNNPIWRKYYTIYKPSFQKSGSLHEISDIEPTSDGNYIAYGTVKGWSNKIEDRDDAWLFKIDEDGELVRLDTTNSTFDYIDEKLPIKIYPNPTSDLLYISQGEIENVDYSIIDAKGVEIFKFSIEEGNNVTSVDIENFDNGVYFLQIKKGKMMTTYNFLKY